MMPQRRRFFLTALKVVDLCLLGITASLTTWFLYGDQVNLSFHQFWAIRIKVENALLVGGFGLGWHIIFSRFGLYQSKRLSTLKDESIDILKAITLGMGALAVIAFVGKVEMVSPQFLLVFWIASCSLTIGHRLILRSMLKQVRVHGRNLRHLLIVGTNPRTLRFAEKLQAKPELGYRIIGFVDEEWQGLREFAKSGFSKVTDFLHFQTFLRRVVVDEVVVGLPIKSYYQESARIIEQCEEQGVQIRLLGDMFTPKRGRGHVDEICGQSLLTFEPETIREHAYLVKRIIDVAITLPVILFFSPMYLLIALGVKLTSPGPIFFVQDRIGLNKRRFRLIKFRTMVPDAEARLADLEHLNEVSGAAFKIQNDPRLTPFGKFLRKTSLDEFPQLFNVLKGDMSLVGPRPLPVRDFEEFTEDWHRRRFSVHPGVTCLWQVNGRSQLSFEKWMELDMQYIDEWSLWLDVKILLKTIPVVLRGTGAV